MADIRVGGAYVDFIARNARFVAGVRKTGAALKRQERAVRSLHRTVANFNRTARAMASRMFSVVATDSEFASPVHRSLPTCQPPFRSSAVMRR